MKFHSDLLACLIAAMLIMTATSVHAFLNQSMMLAGKARAPTAPQTIASISPTSGSCQTGATNSCASMSVMMSTSAPTFAGDGGTFALVASGGSCSGGDTSDFSLGSTSGVLAISNTSVAAGSYTACVKATTTSSNVTNSPQYQTVAITVTSTSTASCGSAPVGAAAADVTAAGFATCALYNDFTTAIPNSVGTGLPGSLPSGSTTANGNWVNCNADTSTTSIWGWSGDPGTCTYISQAIDPINSTRALKITIPLANQQSGTGITWTLTTGATASPNCSPHNINIPCNTPYGTNFGDGSYFEFVFRDDTPGGLHYDIWSPSGSNYESCERDSEYSVELDFIEQFGGTYAQNAGYVWGSICNNLNHNPYIVGWPATDTTQYVTLGILVTNDGNDNFQVCHYYNGTRNNCQAFQGYPGSNKERRNIQFANNNCTGNPGANSCPADDFYIQYVKVLTCHNWYSSNQNLWGCSGTANNGTIYTGAGG